jgi:hypothetical protein
MLKPVDWPTEVLACLVAAYGASWTEYPTPVELQNLERVKP